MPDPPLQIAFIALGFPPDVGGTELYNAEYARRLHARGHALRLFTWSDARGPAFAFPVHRAPRTARGELLDARAVSAWLAEAPPDVVFVSRASRLLRDVVRAAARRAPLVLSVHELHGRHTRRGALGRRRVRRRYGLDRARRVVVNSEDTRRRIEALRPRAPIAIVHPGVDTAAFAPSAELRERAREKLGVADRRVLLTVSRLAANKGHARVIEVLPALRKRFPDLVYLVVGHGGRRAMLEQLAAAAGVADAVRFEGLVDDARAYYAAADVFAMPSGRLPAAGEAKAGEGFGISYLEAGAFGLPAVASASGGGAEVVIDGETGCVIDPGDPRAIEDAIAGLFEDPERARRLGEAARRQCQRFDWERGADALEAVLREAAAAP
ncbi:MAG: glycosyltransferase family 4 protein [Deltaproteobacteria bacterium]|nr:MAG: glycosyltransferase family 4 protein [Deltaproteobacteria bacterium]